MTEELGFPDRQAGKPAIIPMDTGYLDLRPLAGNNPLITPRNAANKLIEVAVVMAINTLSENGALPE